LAGLFALGMAAMALAEGKHIRNGTYMPNAGTYVSDAVYFASATNLPGTLNISTVSAYLYSVSVTSGGASGSTFEVWDSSSLVNVTTSARRVSYVYPANMTGDYPMRQGCLNGVTVVVTTPAASVWGQYPRLQINYYEK